VSEVRNGAREGEFETYTNGVLVDVGLHLGGDGAEGLGVDIHAMELEAEVSSGLVESGVGGGGDNAVT
jgi:hypothetical protein